MVSGGWSWAWEDSFAALYAMPFAGLVESANRQGSNWAGWMNSTLGL